MIVLSVGDIFLGSDYFTYFNGEVEMKFLDIVNCELLALGNHEFDQGGILNVFQQRQQAPKMKINCANLFYENGKYVFPPYEMKQIKGFNIAIVSLLGEDAWKATAVSEKKGLICKDMFHVTKDITEEIRSKFDVDFWVCLSHTGVNRGDYKLAQMGIFDVIFSGHEHFETLREWEKIETSNAERSTCYLHPGNCNGRALSTLTVELRNSGTSEVISTDTILVDNKYDDSSSSAYQNMQKMLMKYRKEIDRFAQEKIGYFKDTHYSKDALGKNFCPINLAPITRLILSSFFHALNTNFNFSREIPQNKIVTHINFGAIRGGFASGDVLVKDVCNVFPFNGTLELVKVPGYTLLQLYQTSLRRAQNRKEGKAPGMGYHFMWYNESENFSRVQEMEDYYILTTTYLRQNDVVSFIPNIIEEECPHLSHWVVWPREEKNHSPVGIRDSLSEYIKYKQEF